MEGSIWEESENSEKIKFGDLVYLTCSPDIKPERACLCGCDVSIYGPPHWEYGRGPFFCLRCGIAAGVGISEVPYCKIPEFLLEQIEQVEEIITAHKSHKSIDWNKYGELELVYKKYLKPVGFIEDFFNRLTIFLDY